MALTAYLTQTRRLLQNPPATPALYSDVDLTSFINTARTQLAGETECIRATSTLSLTSSTQSYAFSAITIGLTGAQSVLNVRLASIPVSAVPTLLDGRPWEWFYLYYVANGTISNGTPVRWAQQGQGVSGTLFFSPTPNASFTASLDTVLLPVALTTDSTPEAIPYPWTDAIPFYAAYYAYMSAQRQADADMMYARYKDFSRRAREEATPTVLPMNLPGDVGTAIAASKSTNTDRPQQQSGGNK
jgi:hypothetical protein